MLDSLPLSTPPPGFTAQVFRSSTAAHPLASRRAEDIVLDHVVERVSLARTQSHCWDCQSAEYVAAKVNNSLGNYPPAAPELRKGDIRLRVAFLHPKAFLQLFVPLLYLSFPDN